MRNKKDLKSIQVQHDKLIVENIKLKLEVDSLLLVQAEAVKNQKREKLFNKIEEMRLRVNSLKREKAKLESELRKSFNRKG